MSGVALAAFLLLLAFGSMTFKNPRRYKWFAVASMVLLTGSMVYLGIWQQNNLNQQPGGWKGEPSEKSESG